MESAVMWTLKTLTDQRRTLRFFRTQGLILLAVVLLVGSRLPSTAAQDSGTREPLTWDHVYGAKRISLPPATPVRLTWLDDESYLQREAEGWRKIDAKTGTSSAWYDEDRVFSSLRSIDGISEADARRMAAGEWMDFLPDKSLAVFRMGDRLIRVSLTTAETAIVSGVPAEIELTALSPAGNALGFVQGNDVWVADFDTGKVRQLTHDASPTVRNGRADWIYYEEVYNRNWQAWRWSPDGKFIAYQQFDDTAVPEFRVSDHTSVQQSFEAEHFPKAGETNPIVRLGIVSVADAKTTWVSTESYTPQDFILAHFNWLPDSSAVYWYAQNRIQTWLDVLVADRQTGVSRKLLTDRTEAWVDNPMDVHFLRDGSFLIFSERTGWKHLYRVSSDGSSIAAVTTGEWEVRELLAVSRDESSIVISGTRDSRIAENLYRVSLSDPAAPLQRLTPEDGQHTASVSHGGSWIADTASSMTLAPRVVMRDHAGKEVRVLSERIPLPSDRYLFGQVEQRDVPMADGSTTRAIFVLPPDFNPSVRYPIWLRTYAGPHAPQVRDAWNPRLADHLLANQGIVVITWDPRSASGYGAKSAWIAWKKLGVEETRDLVSLCDWLATQPWADASRIGLNGHSYGGYFTAYAMTHCDKLCAGIAGAPVTDWANYDTIYTERFMSTPAENPDGYRTASVVAAANQLKGRLLLSHGLKDDNVHPENAIQLMHALQGANKQFDVMFYPKARHGIVNGHYNALMFNFIVRAMGQPEAARMQE